MGLPGTSTDGQKGDPGTPGENGVTGQAGNDGLPGMSVCLSVCLCCVSTQETWFSPLGVTSLALSQY